MPQATELELITASAAGDRAAQAQLVTHCIAQQFAGITPFEALAFAEVFARQAASRGLIEDRLMLAGVLRIRAYHVAELGDVERGARLLAQSDELCGDMDGAGLSQGVEFLAGVLTTSADGCDEQAGVLLQRLMASLSASDADELRSIINNAACDLAMQPASLEAAR